MPLEETPFHRIDFSHQDEKQLKSVLHILEHPGATHDGLPDCIDAKKVSVNALTEVVIAIVQKYPESQLNWYYVKHKLMQMGGRREAACILREILGMQPASHSVVSGLVSSLRSLMAL
ncbi:MAG: hypothetical protein ABIA92_04355 [Patescibacteria group bacterium]